MADISSFLQQAVPDKSLVGIVKSYIPKIGKSSDGEKIGIGGFTAFVTMNEQVTRSSTSPDITLENGDVRQDTIFKKPLIVVFEGEVSDVHLATPEDTIFTAAERALGEISVYLPTRTQAQIEKVRDLVDQGVDVLRKIDDVIARGRRILDILGYGSETKPIQEQFVDFLDAIYGANLLVSIETQYRVYEGMHIQEAVTTRDNKGKAIRFKVTAKQIRTTELTLLATQAPAPSSALDGQAEDLTDKGTTEGEEVPESLASTLLGVLR